MSNEPRHVKINIKHMRNKDEDHLRGHHEADQHLCFHYMDSTLSLLFKFEISSHLLCLYSSVCVEPVQKPHCWFPHEAAQMIMKSIYLMLILVFIQI